MSASISPWVVSQVVSGSGITVAPSLGTGVVTVATTAGNGNILTNNVASQRSQGLKAYTLTPGAWTSVMSFSGQGAINRIFFACGSNTNPDHFMNIAFDGASTPQFGGNAVSPTEFDGTSIACVDLFATGYGQPAVFSLDNYGMSHFVNATNYAGYISVPMPFSTGFNISLFNASGGNLIIYLNVYYTIQTIQTPLRLYGTSFNIATLAYPNEYCWFNKNSVNGVVLKWVKFAINNNPNNANTFEGRFKFYSGGAGMTLGSSINQNHWTTTSGALANQIPTAYGAGASVIGWSTGSEDYFLGSFDFGQQTPGVAGNGISERGGCLYNAASNANWVVWRYYNDLEGYYTAPASTNLVATWSCGDVITGAQGALANMYGSFVLYYA